MAGWSAYIQNLLASSKGITRAAIVGTDASIWARSEPPTGSEFTATTEELTRFVAQFDHLNDVPSQGCDLEGIHYIVPRTEENLIFGKKDKTGIFAVKTNMAVLIACYEGENAMGSECRTAVEKLAAYLKQSGY